MRLPLKFANAINLYWEKKIPNSFFFLAVLFSFPPFLFQDNINILSLEVFGFFLLALLRRGKVKVLPSFFMIISITFFSLLVPYGKVLVKFWGFSVTQGALEGGLKKSLILVGMLFLSQLAFSKKVLLPGKIGSFISLVFFYLEEFSHRKVLLNSKNIIESIDNNLMQVYELEYFEPQEKAETKYPFYGYFISALLPLILYLGLIFF